MLPTVLRWLDNQIPAPSGDLVLGSVAGLVDSLTADTESAIAGLGDLIDPEACPSEFLPFLLSHFGMEAGSGWDDTRKRLLAGGAVPLWRSKGTVAAWEGWRRLHHNLTYRPVELWKSTIYEVFNYSAVRDYGYPYRAARVDLPGDRDSFGQDESQRPIHVLLRPYGESSSRTSLVDSALDTPGGTVVADFNDLATLADGGLTLTALCVGTCETTCQTGCTSACETGCQTACTVGCTTWCQSNCQTACEFVGCQVSCELACETTCMTGCEVVTEGP
jgi:phage tail-like protein